MSAHTTHHDDWYAERIAELEQSETELQDACDKQFKATVRQRERAEKAEAELASWQRMYRERAAAHEAAVRERDEWKAAWQRDGVATAPYRGQVGQ